MAVKEFEITDIGTISVIKRSRARNVRITLNDDGTVKVTIPVWARYSVGIEYATIKKRWILEHRSQRRFIRQGTPVGKSHTLMFYRSSNESVKTRLVGHEIKVLVPSNKTINDDSVQKAARQAAVRALRKESNAVLPGRLRKLALENGFEYSSVGIKPLKTRWGSCSSNKEIKLNCFLMQLDWPLIDYVLIHELMHTRVMAHNAAFWSGVESYIPNYKHIRRQLKQHKTSL